jgi:protein-L-isoaspartate(D-aspartate) O-methyltransferase
VRSWPLCLLVSLLAVGCGDEPTTTPRTTVRPAVSGDRSEEREALVRDLEEEGVRDSGVLRALRAVQRHRFVPPEHQASAYENRPLPIGYDQTISQPFVVASMTVEARLTKDAKVLEVGTGSGYQAAVLAEITPHVFSIEIRKPLAERAAATLAALGYSTVKVRQGDGYDGWPDEAPFDAILVTAAVSHVPPPLVRQLRPGGRMIVPVGQPFATQDLVLVTKDEAGEVRTRRLYPVRFVPLARAEDGDGG